MPANIIQAKNKNDWRMQCRLLKPFVRQANNCRRLATASNAVKFIAAISSATQHKLYGAYNKALGVIDYDIYIMFVVERS